jgi:CDP-glycerol glycerophosphotransferase (TagB/SpsB family)
MLDKFLSLCQRNEELQKPQILSLCDILIADIGRIVSGRIVHRNYGFLRSCINRLRDFSYFISIYFLFYRDKKENVDILIHLTEKTHLDQWFPVYEELKNSKKVAFITSKRKLLQTLSEKGLPIAHVGQVFFHSYGFNFKLLRNTRALLEKNGIESKGIIQYIEQSLTNAFCQRRLYAGALHNNELSAVLVGNDLTFDGRLLTRMANSMGINTHSIQHGYLADDWLQRYHIVNEFYTFGKVSKAKVDGQSLTSTKTITMGAPYLDQFSKETYNGSSVIQQFKEKLGINSNYVLICLSGPGHLTSHQHYYRILESLLEAINNRPMQQFVIKLHPKEKLSDYKKLQFHQCENVFIVGKHNVSDLPNGIFYWLANCLGMITGNSSTAYEALLMNKPIISIDLKNEYPHVEFKKYEAADCVTNIDELNGAIKNLDKNCKNFEEGRIALLNDYFFTSEGSSASARIAARIIENK